MVTSSAIRMEAIIRDGARHSSDSRFPGSLDIYYLSIFRFLLPFYEEICCDLTLFGKVFGDILLKTLS